MYVRTSESMRFYSFNGPCKEERFKTLQTINCIYANIYVRHWSASGKDPHGEALGVGYTIGIAVPHSGSHQTETAYSQSVYNFADNARLCIWTIVGSNSVWSCMRELMPAITMYKDAYMHTRRISEDASRQAHAASTPGEIYRLP